MKKTLIPILILLFCFAIRAESQITTIDLLATPKSEITTLSEIATDVKYIPLQTNENSLIKYVYDFMPSNNKLYIYALSSILCFDNSGKYLYKLDKQGRGPEEYTYITDWDLSPANNLLIMLVPNKILFYNITDKGFVYSKALNTKGQPRNIDFGPDQKSILLSFGSSQGDEPFRNVLINLAGDTLKAIPNSYKYTKNTKMMFGAKYENTLFRNNNSLYFKFWLSDTIFALDKSGKVSPFLKLDSHGKLCTTQALADFNEETMPKYLTVSIIFETPKYLIYRYSLEKTGKYIVYDKVTKQPSFIAIKSLKDTKWLTDDITGGVNIEPRFCIDGIIYSWVDALTLKKYVASDVFKTSVVKFPEKKKAIQYLADSLDETDNPVLIMITPKK